MELRHRVKDLIEYIKENRSYISHNYILNDIYNGNLLPYILADLEVSLSESYYKDIKDRMIPINILTKLIEKLSKSYATAPQRESEDDITSDNELISFYENEVNIDKWMNIAESFSFLFKAYALEPFVDGGKVGTRVLPYDRFLVWSDNKANPLDPTVFIKFVGKRSVGDNQKEIFYAYTNEEFWAFDEDGATYTPALELNDGVNIYGTIPFFYGNRGQNLLPTQDTDLLAMTKTIPKMLSDLSGTILYNSFPIVYTVDVKSSKLIRSPNAIWDFKSDTTIGTTPQVNTITPDADIVNTLEFVAKVLATWLEFRGIKAGNMGNTDNASVSAVSKVIDTADTLELRKISQVDMAADEKAFWQVLKTLHNVWVDEEEIFNLPKFSEDFKLEIRFDEPKPIVSRKELVDQIKLEVESGFMPLRMAIEALYPNKTPDQVEALIAELEAEKPKIEFSAPDNKDS